MSPPLSSSSDSLTPCRIRLTSFYNFQFFWYLTDNSLLYRHHWFLDITISFFLHRLNQRCFCCCVKLCSCLLSWAIALIWVMSPLMSASCHSTLSKSASILSCVTYIIFMFFKLFDCQIDFFVTLLWHQIFFTLCHLAPSCFSVSHSWHQIHFDRLVFRRPYHFILWKRYWSYVKFLYIFFCRELNSLHDGKRASR